MKRNEHWNGQNHQKDIFNVKLFSRKFLLVYYDNLLGNGVYVISRWKHNNY